MDIVGIPPDIYETIKQAVRLVLNGTDLKAPRRLSLSGDDSFIFLAKITSNSGAAHAWTEQRLTGDTATEDAPGGRSGTTSVHPAFEANGRQGLPAGTLVWIHEQGATDADLRYWFVAPDIYFPVKVEKTGGSQGTPSTAATYTYTVKSLAGATLGTGVGQTRPRDNGRVTFQSGSSGYGVAFYDGTTLILWDAGEKKMTKSC